MVRHPSHYLLEIPGWHWNIAPTRPRAPTELTTGMGAQGEHNGAGVVLRFVDGSYITDRKCFPYCVERLRGRTSTCKGEGPCSPNRQEFQSKKFGFKRSDMKLGQGFGFMTIRSDPICPGSFSHWDLTSIEGALCTSGTISQGALTLLTVHIFTVLFMVAKSEQLWCPSRLGLCIMNIPSKLGRHLVLWTNCIYS